MDVKLGLSLEYQGVSTFQAILARLKSGFPEGALEAEKDSLFYWGTAVFGAGIGVYFLLPFEPSLWVVLTGVAILGAMHFFSRHFLTNFHSASRLAVMAGLLFFAGMALATVRTELVGTDAIARKMGPVKITGTVELVEDRIEGGLRLTLRDVGGDNNNIPARLRIVVRTSHPKLGPGMQVETLAILLPLPEPVIPGGYDFGRQLWFQGLGAVGFAVADVRVLEQSETTWKGRVESLRMWLHERITMAVPGREGGVAAALVTGIRDDIPERVNESMRIAGLAHLLAISGLHMALVTGVLFFALRGGMALIPPLALKFNIKKFAALGAFFGALGYLIISGAGVSTQRAFIMVSIVLLAILTDRQAISMRLVALAAIVVLVLTPEALIHPSFQMSFAAVIGLVAGYKYLQPRLAKLRRRGAGFLSKTRFYVVGVLLSTLIAELSIGPIALYHFGRFSVYGLMANLLAVPFMGLWVMPMALLGLVLIPVGLDTYAWQLMALGISIILNVADFIASQPGADFKMPGLPLLSLVLILFAGLWLCLWQQTALRRLFFIPLVFGLGIYLADDLPDILMEREGLLFAAQGPNGLYYFSSLSRSRFSRENWQRHIAQVEGLGFDDFRNADDYSLSCDKLGCLYGWKKWRIAIVEEPAGFAQDCKRADIILTRHYAPFPCKDEKIVIDRARILDNGAHAIWLDGENVEIKSVGEMRGLRPWVVPPD